MRLSVIIPCYNVQNSIHLLVNSVLGQIKDRDIEVICVNDGSVDNTLEVLSDIAKSNPQLIVVNQKNGGPASARKAGLNKATGNYIWFVDGDDSIAANAIDTLLSEIDKNPTDIICFDYKKVDSDGNDIHSFKPGEYDYNQTFTGTEAYAKYRIPAYLWNRIIKRELIEKNNIRFGIIPEDEDFLIHTYLAAGSLRFINDILYDYKQFDVSFSKSLSSFLKYYNGYFQILKKYQVYATSECNKEFWTSFLVTCIKNAIINYNRVRIVDSTKIADDRFAMYKKLRTYVDLYDGKYDKSGMNYLFILIAKKCPFVWDYSCYLLYKHKYQKTI